MDVVKYGSRGPDVKTLQTALGITPDGFFGKDTEAAVKAFQKAHGLDADGIVGPKTWAALGVSDTKCIAPCVVYLPLGVHITKAPGRTIKYIAIHYTAGRSSAEGSARAVKQVFQRRKASADFAVDDKEMVQFNPDLCNYCCWSVGDTKQGKVNCPDGSNYNTISIEICSTLDKGASSEKPNHAGWHFTEAALENAAALAKILMKRFNIPAERVVRHYDISGKLCPGVVGWNDGRLYTKDGQATSSKNTSEQWLKFKKRLL